MGIIELDATMASRKEPGVRSSSYELWEHGQSGAVFAVRLEENGSITGCRGPLVSAEIMGAAPARFQYDTDPAALAWIQRHRENWTPSDFQSPPHY